ARSKVDLSATARATVDDLRIHEPERNVAAIVNPDLAAYADGKLMGILFDNLIGNAWKFTARRPLAHIEIGSVTRHGEPTFFVRDDGAGFDAAHAPKLFVPFHRLHSDAEFKGTGIGLATVHRIIERHGGRIWAESAIGHGATFYFTLPS